MLNELKLRQSSGNPIRVGLVGLGAMGLGIAKQVAGTAGMILSFMADASAAALDKAKAAVGKDIPVYTNCYTALADPAVKCDVFVEATNSIVAAFDYCEAAIRQKSHVVLMNAEVDLILGPLLQDLARQHGVVVTSDAGDQHGVLARMMEEVEMWGFKIVQAGNMKGFLERHRDLAGTYEIAKKLSLSALQCLAYTDGSKLNIEMAIIANEYGLTPFVPGMEGPRATKVQEVFEKFDFDKYGDQGRIDYILGATEHGGGVYVIGRCDDTLQQGYLNYYKVANKHPYYLFFRPYHLCHLETTRAIALAALYGKAVITQRMGRVADCYAYAKRDLAPGDRIEHAIGSDEVYGLVDAAKTADAAGHVPQGVLDVENAPERPIMKRAVKKDQPITWDDVEIPDTRMLQLWTRQKPLVGLA